MALLHWETVRDLGRIPHSAEKRAISMEEAFSIAESRNVRFFIEMFSHRWDSAFAPDDHLNSKAKALVEWAENRWTNGLGTFFWVDFACIDQSDIAPGVAMLPLYVSSCNNIICYDTLAYEPRAWTRVERLMFAAFVAPNCEFIGPGFRYEKQAERLPNGDLKPNEEGHNLLSDPEGGDLSYVADSPLISRLKHLCTEHWARCWKDGLMEAVEDKGMGGIRNLEFGKTQVRWRKH
eukprot:gnl/TRDRNA2_/TRDRNA2_129507_c1_seq1.p1 gnl/TRDRNA2_/TRDRNA2_129507_c1~~gnl/TRDRNA2_/TRDRNA2_129507_c1_seq1.p1  ORF type:complete len:235 (-),score=29.55 gnl/TRDRNA2_/TRDRNA2_129507_c1_seq1:76-780(-)